MWIPYGRRAESGLRWERLGVHRVLNVADRWLAPVAIAILFAYPNPFVPAALALLATYLIRWIVWRPGDARSTPLDAGFALLLAGTLIGFAVAHRRDAAELRLAGVVAAVGVYYVAVRALHDDVSIRLASRGILAAVAVGIVIVLALLRGSLPESAVSQVLAPVLRVFSGFPGVSGDALDVNARFTVHQYGLAHLLLVAGAFAAAAAALGRRRTAWWGLAALVAVLPFLLATQSRGAILALAIAATIAATFRSRLAWALLPLAGGVFYVLLTRRAISRGVEGEWLSDRLWYWTATLSMLGDVPFTGVGLGIRTFAEAFAWYERLPSPYVVPHTHNIVLQAYAEQGLLGAIGLTALVVFGCVLGLRASRRTSGSHRWLVVGAYGSVLGSALYGMTDQVPSTNLSLALVFALLAVIVGADRLSRTPHQSERQVDVPYHHATGFRQVRPSAWGVLTFVAFATVLLVGGAMLAPRWISGLYLNLGSSELLAVVLDRGRDGDLRQARRARASAMLEQAWAWNERSLPAIRGVGRARLLRHDLAGAHAAIQAAYRPDASAFERTQLARLAREAGQIDLTITLLREGNDEATLKAVADEMAAGRRWQDAARAYAALAELNPDQAEYASNAAKAVLDGGGDVEQAMSLLQQAVATNPGAARNLARQLTLRGEPFRNDEKRGGGNFAAAQFWFTLASRIDPAYDRPEVELGSLHFYRGRYDVAGEHFGEALRRDPRNSSTFHQLAETYVKLERLTEAVALYERGVALRPERAELHANLARAYLLVDRRADAIDELRLAASLSPLNSPLNAELNAELGRVEGGG